MNLDWSRISRVLGETSNKLRCHVVADAISSTNDWSAWSCGDDQLPAVCIAEQQTSGRGRKNRIWLSPAYENIYFSLVWPFDLAPGVSLNGLSLVAGIVIARVLSGYGQGVKVKWPNDVLANGEKVAGVLIETKIKQSGRAIAIIGAGINYALSENTRLGIGQPCNDFMSICQTKPAPDRNQIVGEVLKALIEACEKFDQYGFAVFMDEWDGFDACAGQDVLIQDSSGIWSGKVVGLNDQCALKVLRDNTECVVYAADVSIRIK